MKFETAVELSVEPAEVSRGGELTVTAQARREVAIVPSACGFHRREDDRWIAKQIIDWEPADTTTLQTGGEYEWLVSFDDRDNSIGADRIQISLAPHSPAAANVFVIPIQYNDRLVSYAATFEGDLS
ncbi:hypothetical protein [Natronoglomus mannanivorans]|uniref:Uncharacterized protein n=1 Tax=Natronoglomus mannanivorans TaxID=2979990 RepID=A0AAP2Z1E8_9EURY|nr:hypothetical protein [Halobacteria archaeon AArc-xg1-1]